MNRVQPIPIEIPTTCGGECLDSKNSTVGHCPESGTAGAKVDLITVKALLRPDALRRLEGREYRFCPEPHCDVVYFDSASASKFRKDDLVVRVGQKESQDPIPVCYCFDVTMADLRKDITARGDTDIPQRITEQIRAGHCACEVKSPAGSCCLGLIHEAVKKIKSQIPLR